MWQKYDDGGQKYKSFRAWYTNVTRWLTPSWDSDCESTGIYLVRVQVPTRCECRYLPSVSTGTYPVWVQVPTRWEYRYLPGVSADMQIPTRWESWYLPGESTGIYLVWVLVLVPTWCECSYLPGVSAGTCTYPVRVLVPTRCEYRYLPVVIRAASDQFGGDVATAVQHWQAVHNKQLTLLYTKQPVHNKQLTLLNTKATCTQETVNPIIYKTIWTQ